MGPLLKDSTWVRQSFLVRKEQLDAVDQKNRVFTTASLKFTDTTMGGNICINPPPQFTRHADPKAESRLMDGKGMGRYYSEAIDDNNQIIHMRFGVPQFNSLTSFFTSFYNSSAGQLARTGRGDGVFYALGRAAGFVVSIASWKLLSVHLLGLGVRFLAQKPSSKYYYLKPTMPLYWNAVTTMVNHIAVNRGIVPRVFGDNSGTLSDKYEFTEEGRAKLHDLLPDIFNKSGSIDVYAVANRAQRLARRRRDKEKEVLDNMGSGADLAKRIQEIYNEKMTDEVPTYETYLKTWVGTNIAKPRALEQNGTESSTTEELKQEDLGNAGLWEFMKAEFDDGAAFASFRVNSTGPVNESFSNSVTESEISNKINSMSSQSRSTNFSFANGNVVGGALGAALGGVVNAVRDVGRGVIDSLSISGLAALGGAAFVDIPKHWQSSTANLPRASYTINLTCPYGNPISQLQNLHLPLAMLLAGALPISTGKQSYTSPFLVELYDRGRCQTRLGIIDQLSITRGTGNLGFTNDGTAMGIDVTFSVMDLSSIMHMPISEGFSLTGGIFDEDTVFSDYMAVLAGMGLADQIYSLRKLKLRLTLAATNFGTWTSASHFASFAGDTFPGRMVSAIFRGTAR